MGLKAKLKQIPFVYHLYMVRKDKLLSSKMSVIGGGNLNYVLKRNLGDGNFLKYGRNVWADKLEISIIGNHNSILIGDNVVFKKRHCQLAIHGDNCKIEIGDNCSFSSHCILTADEDNMYIKVGNDCMFSNHILVRTNDSHPIYDNEGRRINDAKPIIIGDHVWIAADVIILKGSKIGDGCVVGTKSVVTKEYPSNCVVTGIPARVVKENIYWERELKNEEL